MTLLYAAYTFLNVKIIRENDPEVICFAQINRSTIIRMRKIADYKIVSSAQIVTDTYS